MNRMRHILLLCLSMGFLATALVVSLAVPVAAQDAIQDATAPLTRDRATTGGATTLEDILARQRGETVDPTYRASNTGATDSAAGIAAQLGTLGGASDADIYRALRYGSADVTVSARGPAAGVLIQDGGMWWLQARQGWLPTYGAYVLGGTLVALALFYLIRGRIRIDGEKTGRKMLRFNTFERFGHWLFAGSFLVLALTGLITLFGRKVMIPLFGHDAFAMVALGSKWVHNNIAWAFIAGLILVILTWTLHNIPNRHDVVWMLKGGGLFSKGVHPPARKFNAGQKIIFWACVVLGLGISASGLSLLFPFELPMFGNIFGVVNTIGVPGWFGFAPLPEAMTPQAEMQYAQLGHAIIAFVFIAIIMAHIYLGTLGMEGAVEAMTTGEVDEQWAREHHGLWVEEVLAKEAEQAASQPAE